MLQDSVDDAGAVEPGRDGEPTGHGGGPEPADLLHRPDVELEVRALGGQRVQAALRGPCEVAAEIGFGVLAGGALEAGQLGSYRQPQPIGERLRRIGGRGGQFGEGHHALTLNRLPVTVKLTRHAPGGRCGYSRADGWTVRIGRLLRAAAGTARSAARCGARPPN